MFKHKFSVLHNPGLSYWYQLGGLCIFRDPVQKFLIIFWPVDTLHSLTLFAVF